MNYLVCYTWNNLRGNHAGFQHICYLLSRQYSDQYKVINEYASSKRKYAGWRTLNKIINYIDRHYHQWKYKVLLGEMLRKLQDEDKVYLMEYLHPDMRQDHVAQAVRNTNPNVRIYGLVHITPSGLESVFRDSDYIKWGKLVDAYLTLGSSLTNFIVNKTKGQVPVHTLFHPVDSEYFYPIKNEHPFTVVMWGNMQRDYKTIEQIISLLPHIRFVVCAGYADVSFLNKYDNVETYGYIPEYQLRSLLRKSDVSLNVMEDTVGSNVITITMAMALAVVVSDIGSIRDYCSDKNAIFCHDIKDYVDAIESLWTNPTLLADMKKASLQMSKIYTIENLHVQMNVLK